jgi:hypothetical protein
MDEKRDAPAADRSAAYDRGTDRLSADPMKRHGSEWGMASLLTGGMLSLGALVFLHLAVTTRQIGHSYFDRFDVGVITTLHTILTVVVLPITLLSIFAGLKAIFSARRRGQPIAYGLMGFLMSGLALYLCICACVAGFAVLFSL